MPSYGQEAAEKAIQLQILFYYGKGRTILKIGLRAGRVELRATENHLQGAGMGSHQGTGNRYQENLKNHYGLASVTSIFYPFE